MRIIFFLKCLKLKIDFRNVGINWGNAFCFWDNCIWIGTFKLSLLRTRYFCTAANVLTSSTKIFHVNKRDFFQHNFLASDQLIWERCCNAGFNSAWVRLPCCLSKGPLKQHFLDVYLTTFTESVISKNKIYEGHFFFQNVWNLMQIWVEKKFSVSGIIAPELVSLSCLY